MADRWAIRDETLPEAQFVGPSGPPGKNGVDGKDGKDGADGARGEPGPAALPLSPADPLVRGGPNVPEKFGATNAGIESSVLDAIANGKEAVLVSDIGDVKRVTIRSKMKFNGHKKRLYVTGPSLTGATVCNHVNGLAGNTPLALANDVVFSDTIIDFTNYLQPVELVVESVIDARTVVFVASENTNKPIVGLQLVNMTSGYGLPHGILNYNPTTRTATVSVDWRGRTPVPGDVMWAGFNDCSVGVGGGCDNIEFLRNQHIGCGPGRMVPPSSGNKGINLEQGNTNCRSDGEVFKNWASAIYLGYSKTVFSNTLVVGKVEGCLISRPYAENCASVVTCARFTDTVANDGDLGTNIISDIRYKNCGHVWDGITATGVREKGGVVNFCKGGGLKLVNIYGVNDPDYPAVAPGYPPANSRFPYVGAGLDGPIGAMFLGHGRNIEIDNWTHRGDADCLVKIARCLHLGDPGMPAEGALTSGWVSNCYDLFFRRIKLIGSAKYAIMVDPVQSRRIPADQLTGEMELQAELFTMGIVDPNMAAFKGVTLKVTQRSTGQTVRGTPEQIFRMGNSFAVFPAGMTDLSSGRYSTTVRTVAQGSIDVLMPWDRGVILADYTSGSVGGGTFAFTLSVTAGLQRLAALATLPNGTSIGPLAQADVAGRVNYHAGDKILRITDLLTPAGQNRVINLVVFRTDISP